ncbi:GNAT family N-acetyltransferase [Spirillospora sp. CA-142024]|uniref:GNAT family N-acetyltransferase n=1 Tax=Spirillospora sp. CA-142024 TaxID=3240036 RepID=UPI003D8AB715
MTLDTPWFSAAPRPAAFVRTSIRTKTSSRERVMEIRRIHRDEGDAVGRLWDRMCREMEDGGPLTERGRGDLSRMLAVSAFHRDAFCLVAVDDTADDTADDTDGPRIAGFVNGRTTAEDGLLPCLAGEIDSLYVVPEERGRGISRALAEAAVHWLRDHGARTVHYLSCADAHDDHRFWQSLGFEPDMICLSLYRE